MILSRFPTTQVPSATCSLNCQTLPFLNPLSAIISNTFSALRSISRSQSQSPMASSAVVASSLSLKPSDFAVAARGRLLPSLARANSSLKIVASGGKKIKTDTPYGTGGGMNLRNGVDASGRKPTGKGVYQYVDKYGANVDGYSPIYNTDEWSATGDVYAGGVTGLAIWAVTLFGLLAGGALLVYNTSALSQ